MLVSHFFCMVHFTAPKGVISKIFSMVLLFPGTLVNIKIRSSFGLEITAHLCCSFISAHLVFLGFFVAAISRQFDPPSFFWGGICLRLIVVPFQLVIEDH